MSDSPQPVLVTQWAVCGIVAAAARFVPVPFLDDVIRARAVRVAVSRTLRAHGRDYAAGELEPLWEDGAGGGMGRKAKELGLKLVFFPVRKYRALFGAVRGVPTDVMRVVLVARTVDRRLARGELTDPARLDAEARAIRTAVDQAIHNMDLRLLTAALADGLSQGRELTTAAVGYARKRFAKPDADTTAAPPAAVAEGAQQVAEILDRPEIAQLLDRFDTQVDTTLAAHPA
jgi:hypothetical protein